jgi:hypothetical protein
VEILTECAANLGNATCFSLKAEIAAQRLQEFARHLLMSVRRLDGNKAVLKDAVHKMAEATREVEIGRRHVPYDHGRAADIPGDVVSRGAQQGKLGVQVSVKLRVQIGVEEDRGEAKHVLWIFVQLAPTKRLGKRGRCYGRTV